MELYDSSTFWTGKKANTQKEGLDRMDAEDTRQLYQRQLDLGGPIRDPDEWELYLPVMCEGLVARARLIPYDDMPITYSELGMELVYQGPSVVPVGIRY